MATTSYRTPGVYVERFDLDPQRLDLGRTDIAGFVGIAERGPTPGPVKLESFRQFVTTFGELIPGAYLGYSVAGFFQNGGRTCWVARVAGPGARAARARILIPGRVPFVLEASSKGAWGNAIAIEPIWGHDRITHLRARDPGGRTQTIELDALGDRDPRTNLLRPDPGPRTNLLGLLDSALTEVTRDDIVWVSPYDDAGVALASLGRPEGARLAGGADDLESLKPRHFIANPESKDPPWGFEALERIEEVSIVAAPDLMAGQDPAAGSANLVAFDGDEIHDAQNEMAMGCERLRDRVAVLDLLPERPRPLALLLKNLTRTSFAACYHPWVAVDDPLLDKGSVRLVPPSGHVAGVYARVDRRRGVHKPPANEVLEGVVDVRDLIDDSVHADLNDLGINAIRPIPGRGILVLGARNLLIDVRWRYVNVRRLFVAIEKTLEAQMQWLTFEPTSPRLWRQIERSLQAFLERLFRLGMIDGENSAQAYFVRCDESTNPPSETDEGRVTTVLGLQPPFPAEFVVVRIGVTRSGIQVEEKGAQDA